MSWRPASMLPMTPSKSTFENSIVTPSTSPIALARSGSNPTMVLPSSANSSIGGKPTAEATRIFPAETISAGSILAIVGSFTDADVLGPADTAWLEVLGAPAHPVSKRPAATAATNRGFFMVVLPWTACAV